MPNDYQELGRTIPKTHSVYVEEASVVCPNCWASIELHELTNRTTELKGTLQDCPFCGEAYHVDQDAKIEIA